MNRRAFAMALLGLALSTPAAVASLLVNGGAESGSTIGWVSTGVEATASSNAGVLGLPPGVGIGNFSFTGGTGSGTSQSLTQTVDVSGMAARIDAGELRSAFSALLQSRRDQFATDSVTATLIFATSGGAALASATFVDASILVGVYDWSLVGDQRIVPVGTRLITVSFNMVRSGGISTDAFVDNVSLDLQPTGVAVPEPTTAFAGFAGVVGAWLASRRRKADGTRTEPRGGVGSPEPDLPG